MSVDDPLSPDRQAQIKDVVTHLAKFEPTSEEAIRANNSFYLYMARIGDSDNYVGAKLVASWHLRNLEMFANLTRLIEGSAERIVVLYGQGHKFLLKQFIRESPDLQLVDALDFL